VKSLGHTLHLDAAIEASINLPRSCRLFFPPDTPDWLRELQTYGIFAAGYVAPEGGTIMAHFGDRLGRQRRRERGGRSFAPEFA
jgi:hypothetical protein